MLTIENPQALVHVILFILALWIIAASTGKSGDGNE
jgi:hypothetical protein